jgi:hypothetical protein
MALFRRRPVAAITIVVVIVGVIAGASIWFLCAVRDARDAAQASQCRGQLCCFAIAMLEYEEKHGHLPPAYVADANGKPMHSWRVLVLESLDRALLKEYDFNEPWDGPNNRKLISRMPNIYACPSDTRSKSEGLTNYFVVVGRETAFPGAKAVSLKDVKDKRSTTILIAEATGMNVPWTKPQDLAWDSMSFSLNDRERPSISSRHGRHWGGGAYVATVDALTQWLSRTEPETIRAMLTIAGGERIQDCDLSPADK